MIEWAIAAAQSAGIFERIFVSTDDVEITETVLPVSYTHLTLPTILLV